MTVATKNPTMLRNAGMAGMYLRSLIMRK